MVWSGCATHPSNCTRLALLFAPSPLVRVDSIVPVIVNLLLPQDLWIWFSPRVFLILQVVSGNQCLGSATFDQRMELDGLSNRGRCVGGSSALSTVRSRAWLLNCLSGVKLLQKVAIAHFVLCVSLGGQARALAHFAHSSVSRVKTSCGMDHLWSRDPCEVV